MALALTQVEKVLLPIADNEGTLIKVGESYILTEEIITASFVLPVGQKITAVNISSNLSATFVVDGQSDELLILNAFYESVGEEMHKVYPYLTNLKKVPWRKYAR